MVVRRFLFYSVLSLVSFIFSVTKRFELRFVIGKLSETDEN